jgi:type IX secretion system PorP/SprF family membrane protein
MTFTKASFTSVVNSTLKSFKMRKFLNIKILIYIQMFALVAFAQQAPMYTNYMHNTLGINPAYAGSRNALSLTALHRSQWVHFADAPKTQNLNIHAPITQKHIGIGLSLMNDQVGVVNTSAAFVSFAYKLQINEQSKLAFGLSGGVNLIQANLASLALDQQNDPAFQANIKNKTLGNFGFGMYYTHRLFYLGLSVPQLVQNSYNGAVLANGTAAYGVERRHYFFIAGGLIDLGHNWVFKPSTMVKMTEAAPVQLDVTALFMLNQQFNFGAMYRTGDAFGALLGLQIKPQIYLGYAYDWSFGNRTFTYNSGSHEVVLRYDFQKAHSGLRAKATDF